MSKFLKNPPVNNKGENYLENNKDFHRAALKIQSMESLLNIINDKDNSPVQKIKEFESAFKEKKGDLAENTHKWKNFAKKVGAILSCVALVGLYKAFKSPTFFGKSHGSVLEGKIENTINPSNIADSILNDRFKGKIN